jgi:hypothetical protein
MDRKATRLGDRLDEENRRKDCGISLRERLMKQALNTKDRLTAAKETAAVACLQSRLNVTLRIAMAVNTAFVANRITWKMRIIAPP